MLDGNKSKQPLTVLVENSGKVTYNPTLLSVIGNNELPEQEWPEVERQSTGSNLMDKFLDWLG